MKEKNLAFLLDVIHPLFSFKMCWEKRGSLDAGCFHRKLACQRHFLDSRDSAVGKKLLEHLVNYFVTQRY